MHPRQGRWRGSPMARQSKCKKRSKITSNRFGQFLPQPQTVLFSSDFRSFVSHLQCFRHIFGDHSLRQALHNSGFANPRVAHLQAMTIKMMLSMPPKSVMLNFVCIIFSSLDLSGGSWFWCSIHFGRDTKQYSELPWLLDENHTWDSFRYLRADISQPAASHQNGIVLGPPCQHLPTAASGVGIWS